MLRRVEITSREAVVSFIARKFATVRSTFSHEKLCEIREKRETGPDVRAHARDSRSLRKPTATPAISFTADVREQLDPRRSVLSFCNTYIPDTAARATRAERR